MSTDDLSASGGAIFPSGAFLAMAWPPAYIACLKSPGPEHGIFGNMTPLLKFLSLRLNRLQLHVEYK